MLDINFIRENSEKIKEAAKNKNIDLDVDKLLSLDDERRSIILEIDILRAKRNELASQTKDGKPTPEAIEEGKKLKIRIAEIEVKYNNIEKEYIGLMVKVPTIPSPDTPVASDESGNKEVFISGDIPKFSFTPKTHIELAEDLGLIDFDRGKKVAGFRGYYLKNDLSLMTLAMMNYAMNKMSEKGYNPMIPPTLVKGFALFGSGYFKGLNYNPEIDEIYQVATSDKEATGELSKEQKFLVGTAEPSLLAYFSGETLKEEDLPIKICGFSPCYRSEIGSYGKDTKGLFRVHEFFKVEQVVISKADIEESNKLQDEMVKISQEIHDELGFTHHLLQICTGDMSAGKYRAFDIESWLPGMNRWAETGSASNFLDWQARRLDIKYIDKDGNKKFAYLLNNTALPSPRPLIAILENNQQEDGSVLIPKVLQKYIGKERIVKKS
ncbi:MAG TPA: serine--tRNA ligase [Patescibacteria group bacterium]|nr:serine--tRNA ligase [Patescibacteria group bacterium]